jgi:benzodiazapine receptor
VVDTVIRFILVFILLTFEFAIRQEYVIQISRKTKFFYISKIKNGIERIDMASDNFALLKWSNIIAFVATVVVNGLAGSTTLLGGVNTAQISDSNPTLVTPAGYVFSIWGIIYVLLGVFVVYQALPSQSEKEYALKIGWLFVLSSFLNIVWLVLWQYEFLSLSVLLMFLLLSSLILIYLRLGIGKSKVSLREKLAVHLPFSVYLGWITIATIANISVTLVSVGWDGFGMDPEIWAVLVLVVALAITISVLATRRDIAYGLVVVWALFGIAVKQSGNQTIVTLTEAFAIILLIAITVVIVLSRSKRV